VAELDYRHVNSMHTRLTTSWSGVVLGLDVDAIEQIIQDALVDLDARSAY
jgi:hypothetical protein